MAYSPALCLRQASHERSDYGVLLWYRLSLGKLWKVARSSQSVAISGVVGPEILKKNGWVNNVSHRHKAITAAGINESHFSLPYLLRIVLILIPPQHPAQPEAITFTTFSRWARYAWLTLLVWQGWMGWLGGRAEWAKWLELDLDNLHILYVIIKIYSKYEISYMIYLEYVVKKC